MSAQPASAARPLPAIGVAVLANHPVSPLRRAPEREPHRVVVTIPRNDPQTWAIAFRVAAELAAAIAISAGSNGPLSRVPMPSIEAGRHGTCVTVAIQCINALEAADVVELANRAAEIAASCTACGSTREIDGRTHRVVRTS